MGRSYESGMEVMYHKNSLLSDSIKARDAVDSRVIEEFDMMVLLKVHLF
jgi:hypothetical protein